MVISIDDAEAFELSNRQLGNPFEIYEDDNTTESARLVQAQGDDKELENELETELQAMPKLSLDGDTSEQSSNVHEIIERVRDFPAHAT